MVNAIGGLIGTAIAAFIAVRTGKAEAFFVPRMLIQFALRVVFAGSAVIRRPLTGFLDRPALPGRPGWRKLPPVKRAMTELTLAWAALFFVRGAVYAVLITSPGRVGLAAAVARPGLARVRPAACSSSYRYVPMRLAQLGAPDPRPAEPEPAP